MLPEKIQNGAPQTLGLHRMDAAPAAAAGADALPSLSRSDLETQYAKLQAERQQIRRCHKNLESQLGKYLELYEQAPVGYVDFDSKGYICQLNQTAARLLGKNPDELLGKPFIHFIEPSDIQRFVAHLRLCLQTQQRRSVVVKLRGSIGANGAVQLWSQPVIEPDRAQPLCRTALADVSERKQAEEALRESKECFRVMTDTAPVLLWMSGPDGLCTYFNRAWMEFTGRTLKQELGNGWLDSVHPDDLQRTLDAYHLAFESRDKFHFEFRLRRGDKAFRWFLNTGVPRFGPDRSFAGYLGSCVDITERKEAEEMRREILQDFEILVQQRTANLKAANRKLRQEVATRKRLEKQIIEIADLEKHRLGNDLHDGLGQQLTGLAFLSKVLEQKLAAKNLPEQNEAAQLHSLLKQALAQAREMARGLHVVELKAGGLCSALHELRSQVENLYSIACELKLDKSLSVPGSSVATHLFRIAQEAVNNAAKHGRPSRIVIALAREEKKAALTISDDGVGFPRAGAGKRGMGLHTMRYRTEMIGGSFEIRRSPLGGAQVVCSFPTLTVKKSADKL